MLDMGARMPTGHPPLQITQHYIFLLQGVERAQPFVQDFSNILSNAA